MGGMAVTEPRCNHCSSPTRQDPAIDQGTGEKQGLLRCTGCKVVRYCSGDHQTLDWQKHKEICKRIQKAAKLMDQEEEKLRHDNAQDIGWGWNKPFETGVGHFWGIFETRSYMCARMDLVTQQLEVSTRDSVESCLGHLLDMLRLCRGDNLGVRDIIPDLYLRLHRDQEAYDFMKWYATEGESMDYDWGDMSLPFLNLHNEDVMEPVDDLYLSRFGRSYSISVLLLKLRMYLDLKDVKASTVIFQKEQVNYDIGRMICETVATRSPIWTTRPELLQLEGLQKRIAELEGQIRKLFNDVQENNRYVWQGILENQTWLNIMVSSYSSGSHEEMVVLVNHHARSWVETDGAMEWLKEKVEAI